MEPHLREQLARAQTTSQSNPNDQSLRQQMQSCLDELTQLEDIKEAGQRIRARIKWRKKGDACNKDFFAAVRERKPGTRILALRSSTGAPPTTPKS